MTEQITKDFIYGYEMNQKWEIQYLWRKIKKVIYQKNIFVKKKKWKNNKKVLENIIQQKKRLS